MSVALTFGSLGDIITLSLLIREVTGAPNDSHGSAADILNGSEAEQRLGAAQCQHERVESQLKQIQVEVEATKFSSEEHNEIANKTWDAVKDMKKSISSSLNMLWYVWPL
ncbi:hypothetical protein BDV19DRAFT_390844 [Aspergillus venezuelensis]